MNSLKSTIVDLKTEMEQLKSMIVSNQRTVNISSATLLQNIPNPFTHTTTISYTLPQKLSPMHKLLLQIRMVKQ